MDMEHPLFPKERDVERVGFLSANWLEAVDIFYIESYCRICDYD